MTNKIKCLCNSCSNNCNMCTQTELALRRNLTYIYLNNGSKIASNCTLYNVKKSTLQISNPVIPKFSNPIPQLKYV